MTPEQKYENRKPIQSQLRALIEGFASRHAALNVSNNTTPKPLLDTFQKLGRACKKRDHALFHRIDLKLHEEIIRLANVPGLYETWSCITNLHREFSLATLKTCWPDLATLFEGHRNIVDAICEGNHELAEYSAMIHHNAVWYRLEQQNCPDHTAAPLERTTAYIALHLEQPLKLNFIAKHIAHTSPGHLSRLFRKQFKTSFQAYVQNLRLKQAAALLVQSNFPILQIAKLVGYNDASRFAGHFKRQFAITPSQMRKTKV